MLLFTHMKKRLLFSITFLTLAFLLVSCATVYQKRENSFSEDMASEALKTALEKASIQAIEKLSSSLSSIDFIPSQYEAMETNMKLIPGMATLISKFNSSITSYLKENLPELGKYTAELAASDVYESPIQMVLGSDTSASEKFLADHGADIKDRIQTMLENADYSGFESCIKHYNAYVSTRRNSEENLYPLQISNITSEITNVVYDRFSKLLKNSEELYRTTPDPYADEISAVVFGIN